ERVDAKTDDGFCEPRTDTERGIAGIWRDLLHRDRIGVHDNFLDSGGHSMLAVELLSRINGCFAITLPLRAVFEDPTVAGMARRVDALRESHRKSGGSGRDAAEADASSLLVPLRVGGSKPPIFLVAPAGGTVFAYYALAHHLGADQPVYALQDPAFEGQAAPCETIEEMAEQYIAAMRSVQPEGPYRVGGWSFGGTVAYEIARQLGEEAGHVFLIETITGQRAPGASRKSIVERFRLMRENLGARLLFTLSGLATTADGAWFSLAASLPGRWIGRLKRRVLSRQERELTRAYENALNTSAADVNGGGSLLMRQSFARHWIRIALANTRAFKRYKLRPIKGKITLFVAERRITAKANVDESRGWSGFAQGGVDVRTVPGDHFSILRNPNVKICAGILRQTAEDTSVDEKESAGDVAPTLAS
ncbi:MAG: hypothetical protein KJ060_11140, partial [Candidatus Hydrogenedentes bacterium]|nr:hypothetical protein [Candidatus Hydrogenedentota bacterium]